jgi:Holliday junction resolvasome RuvABC endonuclease subunit
VRIFGIDPGSERTGYGCVETDGRRHRAVENLFHSSNARSALKLGHARGVAILAAVEAGCEVVEYTPAEVKRAVVGYGRAEKQQVQRMVMLLLGLRTAPSPYDASDALAVAICHMHSAGMSSRLKAVPVPTPDPGGAIRRPDARAKSWRQYRPPANG